MIMFYNNVTIIKIKLLLGKVGQLAMGAIYGTSLWIINGWIDQ